MRDINDEKYAEAYERYEKNFVARMSIEWKFDAEKLKDANPGTSVEEADKIIADYMKDYGFYYSKDFGSYVSEKITTDGELKKVIEGLITDNLWIASCLEIFNSRRLETHDLKALLDDMDRIDGKK
ncbi:hypothetical protein D081_1951 [Anaerovibrio sp. JC8]|uniref:hypothetical protein n=1 Tax=Anaerovibrio sp. JC8 TaxID=1240085 RepID=UPI000A0B7A1D|nr:hypothetical protein [Anaerovibrio sp. JC8]ORT99399.1 hypothetical protein D081_1951 [Anaerovibrio sp. JC8]